MNTLKDVIFDDFQNSVNECLLRHKSILDILTKLQESQSRVNRAVVKSVTNCGCTEIIAKKKISKNLQEDIEGSLDETLNSHINGHLCENCEEVICQEIGNNLFYLTALCNMLDLNLYDILLKENDALNTLGKYSLR